VQDSPEDADAWAVCSQAMFQGDLWEVLAVLQVWVSFKVPQLTEELD